MVLAVLGVIVLDQVALLLILDAVVGKGEGDASLGADEFLLILAGAGLVQVAS